MTAVADNPLRGPRLAIAVLAIIILACVANAVRGAEPPAYAVTSNLPPQAPTPPQAPYVVRDNTPAVAPAPRAKAACVCGDSCKCAAGACPGKCPVVAKAARKPCAKGNEFCICEEPFPLNPNPGPCTCANCFAHCFPIPAGAVAGKHHHPPKYPTPPGYPAAPAGFHWAKYPSGQWGLVQDGLTPGVAAPAREVSRPASPFAAPATTPGTTAPPAVVPSTSWPGSTATAPTFTFAPAAGRVGGTNGCPPAG